MTNSQTFDITRFKDDRISQRADGLFVARGIPHAFPKWSEAKAALMKADRQVEEAKFFCDPL